jgi:hypothetical protein
MLTNDISVLESVDGEDDKELDDNTNNADAANDNKMDSSPNSGGGSKGRAPFGARARRTTSAATVRKIHEQYETSPFSVWFGLITKLVGSALAAVGFALAVALYPLYALTPAPVFTGLTKGLFNIGYLIYMSAIGRWLHLRLVRDQRASRRAPHSRGRGLHSFTSQLNLSAFYGIGVARRGCVAHVKEVVGGVYGV